MFIIKLSNEGDYLKKVGDDMYRATFNLNEAAFFSNKEDAIEYMNDNEVKFMWNQAEVKEV